MKKREMEEIRESRESRGTKKAGRVSCRALGRAGACLMSFVLTAGLLAGCGAKAGSDNGASAASQNYSMETTSAQSYGYDIGMGVSEAGAADRDAEVSEETAPESQEMEAQDGLAAEGRKLIRTVNMDVETKDYDGFLAALEAEVKELGGYIESTDTYNGSSYSSYQSSRNASLTLRIPEGQLDGFLQMVSDAGNVVRRSDKVNDVTLSYVDLQSHRNALRTEQERLMELLEMAETVEDIITIEDRLSNVRYQLESMESKLRTMDNQVDYSTVYMQLEEVRELTPAEGRSAWERIRSGFVDSVKDLGEGLAELGIWFVIHIPYLLFCAALVVVIVLILRLLSKRGRAKRTKEQD